MINHARTLLMNLDGGDYRDDIPGEEIVDSTYRARELPQHIINIRRILFGDAPDRHMLNYRCRQYMAVLHATELVDFVTDLDPRITYEFDNALFEDALFRPSAKPQNTTTDELFFIGDAGKPISGQLFRRWSVAITATSTATVKSLLPLSEVISGFTTTDGLSSPIPLQGSGLTVSAKPTVGNSWMVESLVRPDIDLGNLVASLGIIGEPTLNSLFGVGTPQATTEPFLTFKNLWFDCRELPYQLGGLLLAVIHSTDKLP